METLEGASVGLGELIHLAAVDNELFARSFFPKAARQRSPEFHKAIWNSLENPAFRFVNERCFRGSAKTTLLRMFTAKRIAYGISRTILYVGASEAHAARSIQWLRAQIEPLRGADGTSKPTFFASTFGLRPGEKKWTDTEIEIFHNTEERPVWVLGVGITGNIRGINFDDYRPDLIVLDDIVTDETAATQEQRDKITELVVGALSGSLTPASEEPNAKIVLLQTPIHADDVSAKAARSEQWHTDIFSCWTSETRDLDVEQQVSAWEDRLPTVELRRAKLAAVKDNTLSTWVRENECRLVSKETTTFLSPWLRVGNTLPTLRAGACVLGVDPVPPPSEKAVKKNLRGNDYEAHAVWMRTQDGFHLMDYRLNRGHEPNWSVATMFELAIKYRCMRVVVEGVAYQRVLKWLFEQEMKRQRQYFVVQTFDDMRNKPVRIASILSGLASAGRIHCLETQTEFIRQFCDYPNLDHDDLLDASAMAIASLDKPYLDLGDEDFVDLDDSSIPKIRQPRSCP